MHLIDLVIILGVFLLGTFAPRVRQRPAFAGIVAGEEPAAHL